MANVGSAAAGKTYIGAGLGASGTFADIGTNSGLAAHGIVIAEGNSPFQSLPLTNGQLLIGATSINPVPATLTAGTGIDITNGAGSITISVASGSAVVQTLTGNTGGAISPTAGNINTLGDGSITIAGSGSTLTTQLTGLTNHAVLVGAGTSTITKIAATANTGAVLQNNAGADPSYSTAKYPSTTTINQILYSSSADTVAGLTAANSASLVSTSAGVPVWSSSMTNGQLIIGSTGATPTAATLTAGTGVSITNAAASITLAVTGGGFTWTDVTGATQALSVQNGYLTDRGGGVTYTLPSAAAAIGDVIIIVGKLGLTTIAQNAGQQILISSSSSTVGVGGSVVGTNVGDCITLRCITSGTSSIWRAESLVGNWTVT